MDNRNFDKLIALKVMGWSENQIIEMDDYSKIAINESFVPFEFTPSTNIRDAWLVVGKLEKDFSSLEILIEDGMTNVIVTEKFSSGHLKDKHQGYEKSTPLSICYAAVRAYGVEV